MAQEGASTEVNLNFCFVAGALTLEIADVQEESLADLTVLDQLVNVEGNIRQVLGWHLA